MNLILWYAGLAVVYGLYHKTFFSYSTHIFNDSKNKNARGIISYLVNLTYWIVYIQYVGVAYEALAIVLFTLLLLVEYLVIFKLKFQIALYIALAFSINLFAKRIAIIGGTALLMGETVEVALSDPINQVIVLMIASAMSVNTIMFARKSISKIYLDTILADKRNIQFLVGIFGVIIVTITTIASTTFTSNATSGLLLFYIFSGVSFILAFLLFLIYAYQLARFNLMMQMIDETKAYNKEQEKLVTELEEEASKDAMTGILSRENIEEVLIDKINKKEKLFLAFIDIDGLKYANDNYGHLEGDFYINKVASTVQSYFDTCSVGRYGGDEFVVVGEYDTKMEVTSKVVRCYTSISQISNKYKKPYSTSISYGVVYSANNEFKDFKEMIALGDERMYEMKKMNKKQRKAAISA